MNSVRPLNVWRAARWGGGGGLLGPGCQLEARGEGVTADHCV